MGKNIKFHTMAITLICGVIVILYVLIGPKPAPENPVQVANGRSVKISSATWGENCNDFMAQATEDQNKAAVEHDTQGNVIPKSVYKPVTADNVLKKVAEICDGKPTCEIYADVTTLGVDPLPTCFKRLFVTYRCYSFDRLSSLNVNQGDMFRVNCAQPEPAANAPVKQ